MFFGYPASVGGGYGAAIPNATVASTPFGKPFFPFFKPFGKPFFGGCGW
ncbi:MAG: hypothetical protein ACM3XM_05845 [Mycobacterium leprae]